MLQKGDRAMMRSSRTLHPLWPMILRLRSYLCHYKIDTDLSKDAWQNSSLPHKCGVPLRPGTPHLCGRGKLQREFVLSPLSKAEFSHVRNALPGGGVGWIWLDLVGLALTGLD